MKTTGHPKFNEILEEMKDVHARKNANYSTSDGDGNGDPLSNFKECERLGISAWMGVLIRMGDKWCRLQELAKGKPDMVGESFSDTLTDLANYAILCRILYEEAKQK